ncbi:hypothetical protein WJX77_012371 [Trebouxia sp. C0004]
MSESLQLSGLPVSIQQGVCITLRTSGNPIAMFCSYFRMLMGSACQYASATFWMQCSCELVPPAEGLGIQRA